MNLPRTIRTIAEVQAYSDAERADGARVALVPTMGALHAGHLSLVEEARKRGATRVIVSIFVNPTQFGPNEDFSAYPRTWDSDFAKCAEAKVNVVFAPTVDEMYPRGAQTRVAVGALAQPLCGASRPGHFEGVATVVCKLFLAARPHLAVFGEKDYQQLAVLRRMAHDLNFGIEIVGAPIARDADGLALSSRNQHLDKQARCEALVLSRALEAAQQAFARGECRRDALLALVEGEIGKASRAQVDYVELCDVETLAPVPEHLEAPTLLALAVFFDVENPTLKRVRLIDNAVLSPTAKCNSTKEEICNAGERKETPFLGKKKVEINLIGKIVHSEARRRKS